MRAKQKASKRSAARSNRTVPATQATRPLNANERYDAKIDHILRSAAAVFAEKSFGLATVRDIAAHARISFPRIYYYLRNKEELLFLISKRTFDELQRRAAERLASAGDPAERLRLFIHGHLEYLMANIAEMKVLAREADSLSGRYAIEIARMRREYSRLCRRLIEQFAEHNGRVLEREQGRIVTSLLFGAMNWFYTWYEPARDFEQRSRIAEEVFRMIAGSLAVR